MNQVEYTLLIQKIFLIATSGSFLGLSALLVFVDPYDNPSYIWAFLFLLLIFLSGLITLLFFWWFFSVRKKILTISQVNNSIYQSVVSATVIITLIALNQTDQLNLISAMVVGSLYLLYWFWSATEDAVE